MALVFAEGFEEYNNFATEAVANITTTAYWSTAQGSTSSAQVRTTQTSGTSRSWACRLSASTVAIPSQTEYITGFGLYYDGSATSVLCEIRNTAGNGIRISRNSSDGLVANRISNGATLATSANGVLSINMWKYIEFRVKVDAASGIIQVRVDGSDVINLTGQDTTVGSVSDITQIYYYQSNSSNAYIDDLYICDVTGAANNTFLGPISIYTLAPNGVGASSQFTPTGAANNWDCVNELGGPDTTTYVTTSSGGQADSYTAEDLPITPTSIAGVILSARSMKTDSGSRTHKLRCTVGANTARGAAQGMALNSYGYARTVFETAPDGSAWTAAAVNSMEIGVESV